MEAQTTAANESLTWQTLYTSIGNAYGVAGLMGNLYAESALIANNLQNSYNSKLGYTDKTYTDAVDSGAYTKFSSDSAGYGLAQWTYSTRKANLLTYAKKRGASVGNLAMQLSFLIEELKSDYAGVWKVLTTAKNVKTASNAVLLQYERPADTSSAVQSKRAAYGETYFTKYGTSDSTSGISSSATTAKRTEYAESFDKSLSDTYTVTATALNVRYGAGTSKGIITTIQNGETVRCYGYYTEVGGVKWLYVQLKNGTEGFCSEKYLKKG